jgi:hypothetical protein
MKKIAALVGAGALVLALVVPAMATWTWPSNDVTISNWANVSTKVNTSANTGSNRIGGKYVWGGKIKSGEAMSVSLASTTANTNSVGCLKCGDDVTISNWANVSTKVNTSANTGNNSIGGKCVGGGSILTGDAVSQSEAYTVVNTNVVGE